MICEHENQKSGSHWTLAASPKVRLHLLAAMRLCKIERGTDWNDASGINFSVRHVVMALNVIGGISSSGR